MLKIATVCTGIGSPEQALENLGIDHEIVFGCEIDKYARQTYLANFNPKMMLEDMTKETWEGSEYYADLLVGGIPCFKADTLITTSKGLIPIQEIRKDDLVLTHKNRFRKVIIPMVKKSKNILNIKIQGSPLISATEEHPFYVRTMSKKWNNERRCDERVFSEPEWINAKDLKPKNHFVGFGMNNENINTYNLSEEECWYLGRYMADGYCTSKSVRENGKERNIYKTTLCIGKSKIDQLYKFKEIKVTASIERTVYKYNSYNKRLHSFCIMIGKGADKKEIPSFILNLPIYLLKIFIDGYISGDGSVKDGKYSATTVSKKLAYSLCQAVYKCYKTPCSITFTKRPPKYVIEGRVVNQKDTYRVQFCKETRKQNNAVVIDGIVWQPVKSIVESLHNDLVYNFEVEEDNSYVAENCIVHNCQAFSLAGKRLGELDPRGLLFYDFYRYVKVQQPKFFIIENVKGLLSMNDGEVFQNWINLLGQSVNGDVFMFPHEDSLMYNLHWQVLNTKDYGLPQNRERVFLIGIRNDLPNDFVFPKGIPLSKRLKDVLETNVDEKYYLSNRIIDNITGKDIEKLEGAIISNQGQRVDCLTDVASTLMARDYKGFGNQGMTDVLVNSATKSGYEIATEGDSINLEHPNSETRRGRVGKGVAQTLTTSCNQAVIEPQVIGFCRTEEAKKMRKENFLKTGKDTGSFSDRNMVAKKQDFSDTILANPNPQKDGLILEPQLTQVAQLEGFESEGRIYDANGISRTIKNGGGGGSKTGWYMVEEEQIINPLKGQTEFGWHFEQNVFSEESICRTLKSSEGSGNKPKIIQGYRIRRLSPLECFRLQGFPDSFVKPVSDTQLYKQAGNTITTNVIEAILKNLLK